MIPRRPGGGWVLGRPVGKPTTANPGSDPLLLPFAFAGLVSVRDPIQRYLEIGPRAFAVAPNVAVVGLGAGIQ